MGRTLELSRLVAGISDSRPLLVTGEPGVGKTTLIRTAAETIGGRWFEGGAFAVLSQVPYLPMRRALGVEFPQSADASFVAREVEGAVGGGLLLLDDLQWADPGTRRVVALLAGRIPLLAAARRGDAASDDLRSGLGAAGFEEMVLAPLATDEVAAIVRARRPDLGPMATERLARRSGGNPLIVTELLAAGDDPPETLRLSLGARLRDLEPESREAFELLVLAGRPLAPTVLGARAVTTLDGAGLLRGTSDGVDVRHALIGEEALRLLSPDQRRLRHLRLAAIFADEPGSAARHHLAGGEPDRAREQAMRAARATPQPLEAAWHLAIAARCTEGPAGDEIRLRAARGLVAAGELAEVDATLGDAPPRAPAQAAEWHLLRSRARWGTGDVDGFVSELHGGLELAPRVGGAVEVRLRIEALRESAFLRDSPEAVDEARRALALALERDVEVARARYMLGTVLSLAHEPGWDEELSAARRLARQGGEIDVELPAANNLISAHEMSGDPDEGRRVAREMLDRCAELHATAWEQQFRALWINLEMHAGRYELVVRDSIELLGEPLERRTREQLEHTLIMALIDLGRFDVAAARLETVRAAAADDWMSSGTATYLQAELDLLAGRSRAVLSGLDTVPEEVEQSAIGLLLLTVRAWATFELGEPVPPVTQGASLGAFGGAATPELEAIASLAAGEFETAAVAFDAAAALYARYHRRAELRCWWGAAEALRRAGAADEALDRLRVLEGRAEEHAMQPLLVRIHRSLRALGVRRAAPRGLSVAGGMTPREQQLVRLLAEGLTDAEIARRLGLSRATVKSTIRSALTHLGVDTRGQAVLALRD